jgi:MFS family permease
MEKLRLLLGGATLSSFRRPGFAWLWLAMGLSGFIHSVATITYGWLALEITGTPVAVGTVFAVRYVPRLLFGVPIGALSDRMDRRRMLQGAILLGAVTALVAAWTGYSGSLTLAILLVVAFVEGTLDTAESTLGRALVYDLVGGEGAVNGMALEQLGGRGIGALGSVSAGVLLASIGAAGPFLAMMIAGTIGVLALFRVPGGRRVRQPDAAATALPKRRRSHLVVALQGFAVLWRSPAVLLIAVIGATAEVFAFSSDALLSTFSRDVLAIGATGLGNLTAMRQVGGVAGLLVLAALANRVHAGKLLFWMCGLFAISLVAFAGSSSYVLSLLLMLAIGVAWASLDVLLPKLVQDRVPDEERGAAVGVWNLSRGAGPLGNLETGALAGSVGAPIAQAINASILLAVVLAAAALQRIPRWRISPSDGRRTQS